MKKLLIGGSPCTHWSIAQKNNRETTAEGIGWELFKNYLIAKEKYRPDYFLYENNKSAAQPIKSQIAQELGVWEGGLTPYTDVRFTYINSALVSAQNRQRFYVTNFGDIRQPEDRGILLRDILETGVAWQEKSYCLTATEWKGSTVEHNLDKHVRTMIAEPVRIGTIENGALGKHDSKQYRVYSPDGKATTQCGQGGGVGAKTGLYACPIEESNYEIIDGSQIFVTDTKIRQGDGLGTKQGKYVYLETAKTNTISAGQAHNEKVIVPAPSGNWKTVYEVRNGYITIKDKQYPIKLPDGFYIIRKLTVAECCRLQGMPDWWFDDENGNKIISNSQCYKGLGNGWQLDTVKYLMSHMPIDKDEEIVCLSMYDGIGTGRRILEELGFTNVKYIAYEIDKYCVKLTSYRYPDIVHMGDAFQVRSEGWLNQIYDKTRRM